MPTIIILVLSILFIFGGMGLTIFLVVKKSNPQNKKSKEEKINNTQLNTTQSEMIIEDIANKMIHIGNNKYRVILECSSINYLLKSEAEQELIDESFRSLINSLTYPITMFIQTRPVDNTKMMEGLEMRVSNSIDHFPALSTYGSYYLKEMDNLYETIGSNYERRKYLIIPYDEIDELTKLSDAEKQEHIVEELEKRIIEVIGGLNNINVKATLLDTQGLVELLYNYFHKKELAQSDNYATFLTQLVSGDEKLTDAELERQLDRILAETQNRLKVEMDKNLEDEYREIAEECLNQITKIRNDLGGFYQDKSVYGIKFNFN